MLERRIESIKVRNYRSLANVEVQLEDLTVLVGENGSGKSNLIDVLRFVRDALTKGLDAAIMERGGIFNLQRSIPDARPDIEIHVHLQLAEQAARFRLVIASLGQGNYQIKAEEALCGAAHYQIQGGTIVDASIPKSFAIQDHALSLPLLGTLPEFEALYQFLTNMHFYTFGIDDLRPLQKLTSPYPLADDGSNLLSVLKNIIDVEAYEAETISSALARIIPSIRDEKPFRFQELAGYLLLQIQHEHGLFEFGQESDGTIRAVALLTALYQMPYLPFIAIEEAELMLYPRMMALLGDVFSEAALRHQLLLTSHSPEFMSRVEPESLRIVELVDGQSQIAAIRASQLQLIQKQLGSTGDLLQMGALNRAES